MSKRPTIKDLAREAGVSVATVDRVLNNRHRVKESTSHQVLSAADRIGYHAAGLIKRRIKESQPRYTLHFLLQKRDDYFYQQLGQAMADATEAFPEINGRAEVEFIDEIAPGTIAERLLSAGETADAIAVVAVNHTLVNEAIEALDRKGVPVFCLLTDVVAPERAGYLGLDNHKRGRTAAWAISRLSQRPGQLGIMLGTHRYLGQEMSESSFRSYLREFAPEFTMMESIIDLDDSRLAYEAAVDLITGSPNLVGIYNAGGGAEGLIRALQDEKVERDVVVVCNEITPVTRRALLDQTIDLVIATPVDRLARRTVEAMVEALTNPNRKGVLEIALTGDLYISENV